VTGKQTRGSGWGAWGGDNQSHITAPRELAARHTALRKLMARCRAELLADLCHQLDIHRGDRVRDLGKTYWVVGLHLLGDGPIYRVGVTGKRKLGSATQYSLSSRWEKIPMPVGGITAGQKAALEKEFEGQRPEAPKASYRAMPFPFLPDAAEFLTAQSTKPGCSDFFLAEIEPEAIAPVVGQFWWNCVFWKEGIPPTE